MYMPSRSASPPSPSPYRPCAYPRVLGPDPRRSATPLRADRDGSLTPRACRTPSSEDGTLDLTQWLERELARSQAAQAAQTQAEDLEAQAAFEAYLRPDAALYGPLTRTPPPRPQRPQRPPGLALPPPMAPVPPPAQDPWPLPIVFAAPVLEVAPAPRAEPMRPRLCRVPPRGPRPQSTRAIHRHADGWGPLLDLPSQLQPDTRTAVAWTPDGTTRYYCYAGDNGVAQVAIFSTVAHLQDRIIALATPPDLI